MLAVRILLGMLLAAGTCAAAAPPTPDATKADAAQDFAVPPRPAGAFQLLDGDRVVFVGDTLIERAQNSDYIETFLTARYPDRNVIYRNLGWSGDTVYGDARAGFGTAVEGFEQLRQQIYTLKPTVIFICYGGNSSFDGAAGLERFEKGYQTLLEMLEVTNAEIILLSPIRHEDLGRPLPDPTAHNESIELYSQVVGSIATEHGHLFIDLFVELANSDVPSDRMLRRFTENGIHLSPFGYWRLARTLERKLGLSQEPWTLTLDPTGKVLAATGDAAESRIKVLKSGPDGLLFLLTGKSLPEPVSPQYIERSRLLTVKNLPPGNYTLSIDGLAFQTATSEAWSQGFSLRSGPEFDQVEQLRKAIMTKNRLYFYRWRPQNETYLFGFRKHEQGQNAKEVPMYDPLVSEQEAKITKLRVPTKHVYELTRDK